MCELYGLSSGHRELCNKELKEFFDHSVKHPHGWGLAVMDGNEVQIEKEPLQASRSFYLHERLSEPIRAKNLLAHIRYATIGNLCFSNCHPFSGKDSSGRRWTLIHNGTIFEYAPLNGYIKKQQGETDSERILLYILDCMNRSIRENGPLEDRVRFRILDEVICEMAAGNKLNLLFFDGEYMYVHTNYENSLYFSQEEDRTCFATRPLGDALWEPVPMTTLLAYRGGELVFTGTNHGNCYVRDQKAIDQLYQIFSHL